MFRLPNDHYKIINLRLLCFEIYLDYWNWKFRKNVGSTEINVYNHSFSDLDGRGYFKGYILIGLFLFTLKLGLILPWKFKGKVM